MWHRSKLSLLALLVLVVGGLALLLWDGAETDPTQLSKREAPVAPAADSLKAPVPGDDQETRAPVRSGSPSPAAEAEEKKATQATGGLRVRVTLELGGRRQVAPGFPVGITPMSGMNPDFDARIVRTDATGSISVTDLAPGPVLVKSGMGLSRHKRVVIVAGETTEMEILIRQALRVTGHVVDERGQGIADAVVEVEAISIGSPPMEMTRSGNDGSFSIPAVAKPCLISARARGFYSSRQLESGYEDVLGVKLVLHSGGGSVRGVVLDPDGRPVQGVKVRVGAPREAYYPLDDPSGRTAFQRGPTEVITDAKGEYEVFGLAPGDQSVMARSATHAPWAGSCTIRERQASILNITLPLGATCSGTVRQHDGTVARGCTVGIITGSQFLRVQAITALDGTYQLSGLPPGKVMLAAKHRYDLLGDAEQETLLVAGTTTEWSPRLSGGVTLKGKLLTDNADARPLPETIIEVAENLPGLDKKLRVRRVITDAEGRFEVENVVSGPVIGLSISVGLSRPFRRLGVDATAGECVLRVPDPGMATAIIQGKVVDRQGRPIAGSSVNLLVEGFPRGTQKTKEESGSFRFESLLKDRYTLRAQAQGYAPTDLVHQLAEGGTWDAGLIVLDRAGWISVDLSGARKDLRHDLAIVIRDKEQTAIARVDCRTGQIAQSVPLAAGSYSLAVQGRGVAHALLNAEVEPGKGTVVRIAPQPGVDCQIDIALPPGSGGVQKLRLAILRGQTTILDRLLPPAVGLRRMHRCFLPTGPLTIRVQGPGSPAVAKEIVVPAQDKARFAIQLK